MATIEKTKKKKDDPGQQVLVDTDGEIRDDIPAPIAECVNNHVRAKLEAKRLRDVAKEEKHALPDLIEQHGEPGVTYYVPIDDSDEIYKACVEHKVTGSVKKASAKEL